MQVAYLQGINILQGQGPGETAKSFFRVFKTVFFWPKNTPSGFCFFVHNKNPEGKFTSFCQNDHPESTFRWRIRISYQKTNVCSYLQDEKLKFQVFPHFSGSKWQKRATDLFSRSRRYFFKDFSSKMLNQTSIIELLHIHRHRRIFNDSQVGLFWVIVWKRHNCM